MQVAIVVVQIGVRLVIREGQRNTLQEREGSCNQLYIINIGCSVNKRSSADRRNVSRFSTWLPPLHTTL